MRTLRLTAAALAVLAALTVPAVASAAVRSGSVTAASPGISSLAAFYDDATGQVTVTVGAAADAEVSWELAPACDISSDFWGRFDLVDGIATATVWDPKRKRVRRELTAVPTVNPDGTLTATFQVPEIAGQDLRCVSGGSTYDNRSDFAFFFDGYPPAPTYPKPAYPRMRGCGKVRLYGGTVYLAVVRGFSCAKARRYGRTGSFPRGHCFLAHPGQSRNGFSVRGRMVTMSCGPWRRTDEGNTVALRYVVLSKRRYPAVPPSSTRTFLDMAAQRSHQPELEMPGGADQHTYRYGTAGTG